MNDRRKCPRVEREFEIRYSSQKNTSNANYTVSKNISKTGICMPTFNALRDGDIVKLDIDLKSGKPSVTTIGKVVWIKNASKRPAPLNLVAGVEFTDKNTRKLDSFLKTIS